MASMEELLKRAREEKARSEKSEKPTPTPVALPSSKSAQTAIPPSSEALKKAAAKPEAKVEPKARGEPKPELGAGERVLITSYGDVKIYKQEGEPLLLYEIPSPHLRGEEKSLIDALIEIMRVVVVGIPENLPIEEKKSRYFSKAVEIIEASPELKVPVNAKEFYASTVVREMLGFGVIDPLIQDDQLEEIMVIGPNKPVFVFHRKYDMMRSNVEFYEDKDIRDLIERVARNVGRRIDNSSPLLDARLADGSRVNATIPPVSLEGSTLTLRKFRKDPLSIIDLVNFGTLNLDAAAFLWLAADGMGVKPANVLIAGGTASGKTSTLNILASFIPKSERVITLEDTAELSLPLEHWIRFETRPPGLEGTGEITLDMLMKNALRMRPDRVVVGEIRGEEGFTMFVAMNTGHDGSIGTVHANSANETIVRLLNPPINVPPVMIGALNFVVMQMRIHDRRKGLIRRVTEIAEIVSVDKGVPQLQTIFQWDAASDNLIATQQTSNYLRTLSRFAGIPVEEIKQELEARKKVLKEISDKGIRGLPEVSEIIQDYMLKRRGRVY
ncbi:MAG TPA: CpaF family protein [Candidatus Norongarragalinales archaeon]|jgi:flagellar protein FlaI|nr:CpaF family protein [Candidatus Norongarragalinales archaeon]